MVLFLIALLGNSEFLHYAGGPGGRDALVLREPTSLEAPACHVLHLSPTLLWCLLFTALLRCHGRSLARI